MTDRPQWLARALLGCGIAAASFAPILIRYASDAPALAISLWRCAAGALVLAPFARRGLSAMSLGDARMPALSGAFLAVHFATWISSLDYTSVASSVLLVSTAPIFVASIAWFVLDERLSASGWSGIALALAGTALISAADAGGTSLLGDGLALAGGIAAAGYVLCGRVARRTLGILEYAVVTYAVAAVLLIVVCAAGGVRVWGYSGQTWWAITGLIVGPQLLGHTVINLVLKDLAATTVSVTLMVEPVVATVLAYFFFSEVPTGLFYVGAAAILFGVYLASTRAARPQPVMVE
jgi:drug/metabolite transporter (DMT)-like permease